ncbi:MAG: stage 0 sporulation protein [Candidatus Omnitrophota bacterium]|nr:MAG: stage 0 sporulation protein [Candidatus Omnitrophota bacterium]RKY38498.1 MAG: stage 0 sporulation protein [Candidatus Omnitrophota bacterium]RKY46060.1 MAG: stage 0 sporulation protein [Candidatus Omnitrophota bacterium]HDN85698.1 stage 0 sporulation protein [Candidatus Omnitrophota bacterium]
MKVALVRLREAGNILSYLAPFEVKSQDKVIVEADRGLDYGEVLEVSEEEHPSANLKKIVRKMTPEDIKQVKENAKQAKDALQICARKVKEHKLKMKLVEAEYSFDKKKVIFYFTAEGRVDFRELVKDLAKIFRIRIEMRQIGVRDEARLFGGIGPCGRSLCCVSFLKNFEPVSIKMAKIQRLPLNPSKISGICGRLMCCLFYEYKNYREFSRNLPREGQTIHTSRGRGKVVSVNVLKRLVYIEFEDGGMEKITYPINE